jgi:FxsC-like protein
VAEGTRTRETPIMDRPYFFLSYAHSDSLAVYPDVNPDKLLGEFFGDLAAAVRSHASPRPGFVPGFYDQEIPVAADWKESLTWALSNTQVFVPLYSPGYLDKSLPGREWACFRRRMADLGLPDPTQRFVPVLWTPLWKTQDPEGLEAAVALGADQPGYVEEGLRALLQIGGWYRASYEAVVDELATRIVVLAENSPIEPLEVQDIDKMTSPFSPDTRLAVFAIETAAPTTGTVAAGHDPRGYGEHSADWRPFPDQEISLAEYAGRVAERLDFRAEVSGIKMVHDEPVRRPGIILIDPWFIADAQGRSALESAVRQLPRWVLPLLVLDQPGDPRTQQLAGQVRDILAAAEALPTESSRQAAAGVSSLKDFRDTVLVLVAEAEKQYLRHRRGGYRGEHSRPSLRRPARRDEPLAKRTTPASTPDSLGETPNA